MLQGMKWLGQAATGRGAAGMTSSSIPSGCSTARRTPGAAEATFNQLRDMPDVPATFISVDVCEIVRRARGALSVESPLRLPVLYRPHGRHFNRPSAPERRLGARSHSASLVTLCSSFRLLHGPTMREGLPDGRDGRRPTGQASAGSSGPLCMRQMSAPGSESCDPAVVHSCGQRT